MSKATIELKPDIVGRILDEFQKTPQFSLIYEFMEQTPSKVSEWVGAKNELVSQLSELTPEKLGAEVMAVLNRVGLKPGQAENALPGEQLRKSLLGLLNGKGEPKGGCLNLGIGSKPAKRGKNAVQSKSLTAGPSIDSIRDFSPPQSMKSISLAIGPSIKSVRPSATILLKGQEFALDLKGNEVSVGGTKALCFPIDGEKLMVVVPPFREEDLPGDFEINVKTKLGEAKKSIKILPQIMPTLPDWKRDFKAMEDLLDIKEEMIQKNGPMIAALADADISMFFKDFKSKAPDLIEYSRASLKAVEDLLPILPEDVFFWLMKQLGFDIPGDWIIKLIEIWQTELDSSPAVCGHSIAVFYNFAMPLMLSIKMMVLDSFLKIFVHPAIAFIAWFLIMQLSVVAMTLALFMVVETLLCIAGVLVEGGP